jgi:hypothetical protein
LLLLKQPSAILLLKPLWMREQPADFFPTTGILYMKEKLGRKQKYSGLCH